MQADVLNKTVVSMKADEGPAYGVALLAAVGAGEFKDIAEACDATVKTVGQTKPAAAARQSTTKPFRCINSSIRRCATTSRKSHELS